MEKLISAVISPFALTLACLPDGSQIRAVSTPKVLPIKADIEILARRSKDSFLVGTATTYSVAGTDTTTATSIFKLALAH